ncbi:hypothetical protein EON65_25185 [archaeon]|nr:MAG: hypothetical protein EON65_25185 [archaeon]
MFAYCCVGRRLERKRLDGTFYNDTARAHYARRVPLGTVRTSAARDLKGTLCKDEEEQKEREKKSKRHLKNPNMDLRQIPKLQSIVLTTRHPGMKTFEQAATMSMTK